jgi:quercetin dioxygenase-like cupin family protein
MRPSLLVAFLLGACTTAAVQSAATPPSSSTDTTGGSPANASRVIALDTAERRAAPSGTAAITMLARGDAAFLGKLEMEPGATVPEHRDATEEYIHVLEGGGVMLIDGERYEIGPGDTIYMAPEALVSFENGEVPMVAIQVFAGPAPADKYEAWTPLDGS